MKTRNLLLVFLVLILLKSCVIWSFYPLYTEKDLFENEILTGNWIDIEDSLKWDFAHPVSNNQNRPVTDNKSYILKFTDYDSIETEYNVHLIKLNGTYFLDFYLEEVNSDRKSNPEGNVTVWNMHLMPVHTFAKLTIDDNSLEINWFDGNWLSEQIEGKKIKIRHENNGENLLLTAKTADLQKLVTKHAYNEAAFKDGLAVKLKKN